MPSIAESSLTLDIVEKACNSFVIVNVAISKPSFTKTLPKVITSKIAAMIASGSGEGKVVPPKSVVDLFGDKQRDFNKRVLAPLGALRNRLYERPELDGGRAFTTSEFPAAYPALQADRDEIMASIQVTADTYYEAWCQAGISSAIRTYESVFPTVESWVRGALPSKADFITAIQIEIGLPRRLNVNALDGVALPAQLLADLQAQQAAASQEKLEAARVQVIESTRKALDNVADKLDGADRRLSPSLISKVKDNVQMLRNFILAYDSDARLLEICDMADEKISSIHSTEVWKNSAFASETSRNVAIQASKQLAGLKDRTLPAPAIADDLVVGEGGMLADLL